MKNLTTFIKSLTDYAKIKDNTLKRGYFFLYVLEEIKKHKDEIDFDAIDPDPIAFKKDALTFYPDLFLLNLFKMGFLIDDLVANASYYSVFDDESKSATNFIFTIFLCLKWLFNGITSDVEKIKSLDSLEGKNKNIVCYHDEKIVNHRSNIGLFFRFLVKDAVSDQDDIDDDPFLVNDTDNLRRSNMIRQCIKFEKEGQAVENCEHVDGMILVNSPIVEDLLEINSSLVEEYIVEKSPLIEDNNVFPVTAVNEKAVDIDNGSKNALSILHFINFYRDKWSEVLNVYVVGVASNPHLLAVADFFHDKRVIYVDPQPCYKGFFDGRHNVSFLQEAIDRDFLFHPKSVVISDVRSTTDDDSVHLDNILQFGWAVKKNVLFGTYKFRYPFKKKVGYDQKCDFVFLQAFKRRESAETRMYISQNSVRPIVPQDLYEKQLTYFNRRVRFKGKSCNDCRVKEVLLKKFPVLPYKWASMFNNVTDEDLMQRNDIPSCSHDSEKVLYLKYLNPCLCCNWRYIIDTGYKEKYHWKNKKSVQSINRGNVSRRGKVKKK